MTEPVGMKKWLGKIVIMTLRNAELLQFSKSVEDNADAWRRRGELNDTLSGSGMLITRKPQIVISVGS